MLALIITWPASLISSAHLSPSFYRIAQTYFHFLGTALHKQQNGDTGDRATPFYCKYSPRLLITAGKKRREERRDMFVVQVSLHTDQSATLAAYRRYLRHIDTDTFSSSPPFLLLFCFSFSPNTASPCGIGEYRTLVPLRVGRGKESKESEDKNRLKRWRAE